MLCHWLAVGNCIIGPVHPLLALCDEGTRQVRNRYGRRRLIFFGTRKPKFSMMSS